MNRKPPTAFADALGISDSAYTLLRDLIEARLGVHYDDGKREMLTDKLSQVVAQQNMQSFLDYYYALKYDPDADQYWSDLADHLSVPETYFWRQPEQFQVVADMLAPAHFARTNAPLRIWSAACCSGEEPLGLAIALAESGAFRLGNIEIVASDASPALVQRARHGVYGQRSFRNLPPAWRDRYFIAENGGWKISPELHNKIDWRVINLLAPEQVATVGPVDLIFCRNVFIYFSDAAIENVAQSFSEMLPPDGKLFLGAAESLTRLDTPFALDEIGTAFVYINRLNAPVARNGTRPRMTSGRY